MNSEHIISGWLAQLNVDAREGRAAMTAPAARPVVSPVLVEAVADAAAPVTDTALAASPRDTAVAVVPARPLERLLPVLARARDSAARRAVFQPCLGLG